MSKDKNKKGGNKRQGSDVRSSNDQLGENAGEGRQMKGEEKKKQR